MARSSRSGRTAALGRPRVRAQRQAPHLVEEPAEEDHEGGEEDRDHGQVRTEEPGLQDRHLAPEEAEGRRARHHQRGEQQQAARDGRAAERAPADRVEVGGAVELRERPRGEERDRLGERVVGHVEERPEGGRLPAQAEPDRHDPHVLDARVGEQALEVPLDQDERCRDEHGGEPQAEQQPARELRPQDGLGHDVDPQQGVERAVHHPHGHQNAGRRGRLAVRVRLPGVHGSEAGLGAVADEQEDHRQLHGEGVQSARVGEEPCPVERRHLLAEDALARREQEHRAEQGEGEAHAAEDEELPGRLERRVPVVEGHQEHGGERRRLHGDPEDAEVVGGRDEQHRARGRRARGPGAPSAASPRRSPPARCARGTPRSRGPRAGPRRR